VHEISGCGSPTNAAMKTFESPFTESRELTALAAEFAPAAQKLLAACERRGANMRPFFTVRGPGVQARLWCQSRTAAQIEKQIETMRFNGAHWLASLMDIRWAKTGPAVTNALPGMSWHQWGEAIDCFALGANGKAIWDSRDAAYRVYGEAAMSLRLEPGAFWPRFPDAVHVQLRAASSPLKAGISWAEADAEMKRRFTGPNA
jgi:peptidoglycan LD-endopeptidase CwlK